LTWIFSAQDATNNAAPTIPPIITCLCCVTFVDGFPAAALPDPLSRHGFISVEGDYPSHLAAVLLKHFELH